MTAIVCFNKEEDLQKLTGLDNKGLWDQGFNLDDWDFGIQSDIQLHRSPTPDEIKYDGWEPGDCIIDWGKDCYWLLTQMSNYCVGYDHTEYNGKHYYIVHHA